VGRGKAVGGGMEGCGGEMGRDEMRWRDGVNTPLIHRDI
jgi:hypothetical protein